MLGDDYINQHVWQAYRDYVERISYQTYMTDTARSVEALLYRNDSRPRWYDLIEEMDGPVEAEKPPEESPEQVQERLLAKLNGREEP